MAVELDYYCNQTKKRWMFNQHKEPSGQIMNQKFPHWQNKITIQSKWSHHRSCQFGASADPHPSGMSVVAMETDGLPTPNCDGSHWWVFIYPDWVSSALMDFWIWSYFQTQKHMNIYLKKNRVANVICIIERCFMYFHAHIAPHSVDGCSSLWIQKYFSAYF